MASFSEFGVVEMSKAMQDGSEVTVNCGTMLSPESTVESWNI